MVLVLGPLADATHLSAEFERAWSLESLREQAADIRLTGEGMEELRSEKINEAYQAEIKRQVEEVVRAYGLTPERTELTFSQENGGFLNITEAVLTVSGDREVYGSEISDIKNELQEVYHISSEHINISIQE